MKIIAILLSTFVLSTGLVFAGVVSDIPPERQVVFEKADYSYISSTLSSTWTPTAQQVSHVLPAIQTYLDKSISEKNVTCTIGKNSLSRRQFVVEQIKQIRANKAGYRVQFWGVEQNGKKLIFCNFFPASKSLVPESVTPSSLSEGGDAFGAWRTTPIAVNDGGSAFFQVLYEPATHRVVDFECNGGA